MPWRGYNVSVKIVGKVVRMVFSTCWIYIVKTACKTMYSLLGTGLHGCDGMNPITAAHIVNIYVIPRLIYGSET